MSRIIILDRAFVKFTGVLDITWGSGNPSLVAFFPEREWTLGYKNYEDARLGIKRRYKNIADLNEDQYTKLYCSKLDLVTEDEWMSLFNLAGIEDNILKLGCYCKDSDFCHTHIMIEYALRMYPDVVVDGRKMTNRPKITITSEKQRTTLPCEVPVESSEGDCPPRNNSEKENRVGKARCLAVVGSRSFSNFPVLAHVLGKFMDKYPDTSIVTGTDWLMSEAPRSNADKMVSFWAKTQGTPLILHLPDWTLHGKSAGFVRNELIVQSCTNMIAFWNGVSKGTYHSMSLAHAKGIKVHVYNELGVHSIFDPNRDKPIDSSVVMVRQPRPVLRPCPNKCMVCGAPVKDPGPCASCVEKADRGDDMDNAPISDPDDWDTW